MHIGSFVKHPALTNSSIGIEQKGTLVNEDQDPLNAAKESPPIFRSKTAIPHGVKYGIYEVIFRCAQR